MKTLLSLLLSVTFCFVAITSQAQIKLGKKDRDAKEVLEDMKDKVVDEFSNDNDSDNEDVEDSEAQEDMEELADEELDDPEKEPYTEENTVNAEAKILVENVKTDFGVEATPGLKVNIVGASRKSLQKDWSKYIKKTTGVRKVVEDRSGEMVADMALIPGLESLPMSLFSEIRETASGAEIISSYQLDEIFLSDENEEKWKILRNFIYEYAVSYRKGIVEGELQDAQKDLKKEQSNLKRLKNNNADLYESIEDYKAKIEQAEKDIITNEKDQKSSNLLIDKLMRAVSEVERRLGSIE